MLGKLRQFMKHANGIIAAACESETPTLYSDRHRVWVSHGVPLYEWNGLRELPPDDFVRSEPSLGLKCHIEPCAVYRRSRQDWTVNLN